MYAVSPTLNVQNWSWDDCSLVGIWNQFPDGQVKSFPLSCLWTVFVTSARVQKAQFADRFYPVCIEEAFYCCLIANYISWEISVCLWSARVMIPSPVSSQILWIETVCSMGWGWCLAAEEEVKGKGCGYRKWLAVARYPFLSWFCSQHFQQLCSVCPADLLRELPGWGTPACCLHNGALLQCTTVHGKWTLPRQHF